MAGETLAPNQALHLIGVAWGLSGVRGSPTLRRQMSFGVRRRERRADRRSHNIMTDRSTARNIDEYIVAFSPEVQKILQNIRLTIREAAPDVVEKISYQIPAFTLSGSDLIYFAAFKKHIGIYPPVKGDKKLSKEISPYKGEKGNLRFPLDEPIPYELISRIVKFRVKEHLERRASKKGAKKR
jgi:uncharacterized protein YdhG (YjbR/CyaY superfamily)